MYKFHQFSRQRFDGAVVMNDVGVTVFYSFSPFFGTVVELRLNTAFYCVGVYVIALLNGLHTLGQLPFDNENAVKFPFEIPFE